MSLLSTHTKSPNSCDNFRMRNKKEIQRKRAIRAITRIIAAAKILAEAEKKYYLMPDDIKEGGGDDA